MLAARLSSLSSPKRAMWAFSRPNARTTRTPDRVSCR